MCPGHSASAAACHVGMAAPGAPVAESPGTAPSHWPQLPLRALAAEARMGREEKRSEPDPGSQYGVWNHLLCEQMSPYALGAVRGMEVSKT